MSAINQRIENENAVNEIITTPQYDIKPLNSEFPSLNVDK